MFVLSRELHKRLPQHFINNSAYGQEGGVEGDRSYGETRADSLARQLLQLHAGQRPPLWVGKGWKQVISISWEGLVRERGS